MAKRIVAFVPMSNADLFFPRGRGEGEGVCGGGGWGGEKTTQPGSYKDCHPRAS